MQNIIYCPVCGTNIKNRKVCPICDYEPGKDYELYPTLGSIPGNIASIPAKHQKFEKQRLQDIVDELLGPLYSELKGQIEELEQKLLRMEAEENHSAGTKSDSPSLSQPRQSFITIKDNTCTLGSYPQDADGTVRPILWRVLEVDQENHKALLLSDKILDCKPYYKNRKSMNWEKAGYDGQGIRYWLNQEFYQEAFPTEEEKSVILTTTVEPHANLNPKYLKDQGKAVQDKIFLLSAEEVIHYYAKSKLEMAGNSVKLGGRQAAAQGSEYTKKNTMLYLSNKGYSYWWLRSMGSSEFAAAYVYDDGDINLSGFYETHEAVGVRPALWVNLEN